MKIVILPGLDGTGKLLSGLVDMLAPKLDVSVLQYPPNLYRYTDLQVWVEDILPKDDFIIVAESFSGPLAIMLASRKPRGLKGIVFVATFARTPVRLPLFLTYILEIIPIRSRLLIRLAQPLLMGRWSGKDFTAAFRQAMNLVPGSTIGRRLREVLRVNTVEQLRRLSLPGIYLLATQDRLVPSRMSLDFEMTIGTVLRIEGPHFLLQAQPRQAADCILNFAGRLG